ncbi:MAG TPA: response regulator [Nitrososphaeraceae archaeon]|nr:response regulator [Nitrososphaeraceae archaeon]
MASHNNINNNNVIKKRDKIAKKKNKILLVDDDSDTCWTFKKMLEEHGYDVDAYDKPQDALQNFKSYIYDLVVLDIKMPKIDGVKLYQEIRKIDKSVRVCFITASQEYYTEHFPELNKEEECFMHKPISVENFVSRVDLALAS